MVQLDWEGHAEHSAKALVEGSGGGYNRVVFEAMNAFIHGKGRGDAKPTISDFPETVLGSTLLYFRRPSSDALINYSEGSNDGTIWSVEETLIQAYAREGDGNSDWKAGYAQPGSMQHHAWKKYQDLAGETRLSLGINAWDLERTSADWPEHQRMSAAQAMDAMVEACLEIGMESVALWGAHLMDELDKPVEAARWALTLAAMRRIKGAQRVIDWARTQDFEPITDGNDI